MWLDHMSHVFLLSTKPRTSTTVLVEVLGRSGRLDVITHLFLEQETFKNLMEFIFHTQLSLELAEWCLVIWRYLI